MRHCFALALALSLSPPVLAQTTPASPPATGRDPNTGQTFQIRPLANGEAPPKEWVDKDTGHRIVRLSDEPASQSMYFNMSCWTPDGSKLLFTSPTGIYLVEWKTRKVELVLAASTKQGNDTIRNNIIEVGRKTGHIFFSRSVVNPAGGVGGVGGVQPGGGAVSQDRGSNERTVWWIDPATKEEHQIGKLPENYNVSTVNADETMLAGAVLYLDGRGGGGGAATQPVTAQNGQRINIAARWAQHLPMALLTMDAKTGDLKTFNPSNDWDNHFLFSPADPAVLMYCHEGPWQNNDRVWTIHTDGTELTKIHTRTMINEIWGHEFWAPDGATSWFQLQYPRGIGGTNWIVGSNLKTHQETWYHLEDQFVSIHVNVSHDGTLFAGDGNTPAPWIFLHRPHLARNMAEGVYDATTLKQPGYFDTERLVNMSAHQYALEPNPIFTPDNKWVVFRSNMFGPSYVYMVEVAKAAN